MLLYTQIYYYFLNQFISVRCGNNINYDLTLPQFDSSCRQPSSFPAILRAGILNTLQRSLAIIQKQQYIFKMCPSSFRKRPCFWANGGCKGNNVLYKKKDTLVENMEQFFMYQETKKNVISFLITRFLPIYEQRSFNSLTLPVSLPYSQCARPQLAEGPLAHTTPYLVRRMLMNSTFPHRQLPKALYSPSRST